jgi:hypothetical protein
MYWVSHKPSKNRENAVPDFVILNKRAASARAATPRDWAAYRKENDNLTPRYGMMTKGPPHRVIPSDVVSGFTYGKQVRPSTPIDDVISHRFLEQAEEELRKFYTEWGEGNERSSSRVRRIPMTRASRGHAMQAREASHSEEPPEERFQLSKFKGIPTKINNGRQKSAHKALLAKIMSNADRASTPAERSEAPEMEEAVDVQGALDAYATF